MAGRWRAVLAAGLWATLLVGLVACGTDEPSLAPPPSPTPGPPILSAGSWQFDGQAWTFEATVNPNGDPTTVTLEWGMGEAFDHVLPVADDVLDGERLAISTREIPSEPPPCTRFRATNAHGTVVLGLACPSGLPVRTVAPS